MQNEHSPSSQPGVPETAAARPPLTPSPKLAKARLATLNIFFINGAALGIWVPHIPIVQSRLELGPAALGLALLGVGAGSLIGMPTAGLLVGRFGSRAIATAGALVFPLLVVVPVVAPGFSLLAAGLFLFGLGNGVLDVAMNAHAVGVERRYRRSIMTSFHAAWSFGGLAGAMASGPAIERIPNPDVRLAVLILPLLIAAVWGSRRLLHDLADHGRSTATIARPRKALLGLGLVALLALIGEGAMTDWSTVYLYGEIGAGSTVAAAGYAAFALAMAIGRVGGDAAIRRVGRLAVLAWSARLGALGMAVALLVPRPAVVLAGFALVGLGAANVIPILFTTAGQISPDAPGKAIAAVAGLGYIGLLSGPILIGSTAEALTLPAGLALVALAYLFVSFGARVARAPSDC